VWIEQPTALQPWINRFAFQSENAEDALMSKAQWLFANESLKRLDAKCKLPAGEGALGSDVPRTQPFKVLWQEILRAVDDAKVFPHPCT
jgi:hypothetical protein